MRNSSSSALRLARRSWHLQFRDSLQSRALAEQAFARARATDDPSAEGWARLTRGFNQMRYATSAEAARELARARKCFAADADRAGPILAAVGLARCAWMEARFEESLAQVLDLRDEGLQVLKHEERGMLLNVIAGCYSSLGQSADAFAYMYQALRESSPARNHGFDVVLYCNLAHELFQLGDYTEALSYLQEGIERCQQLANARILSVLLINRVVCLTDLDRPGDALPDIQRLLELPTDETGRGASGAAFETMAIAALRAGEFALGAALVERATVALSEAATPDERIEGVVATAELHLARGELAAAATCLGQALPLSEPAVSLRVRCLFFHALADVHERLGDAAPALHYLRIWQKLHVERAQRASEARYQAASLQTELMRLRRARDEVEARRRATERAKAELEAINAQLSNKVREVESLQSALQEQAVSDFLTGLFNRRHLNDVLPSMVALAERDQQPLAVVIIDLDRFKSVNDQHGHLAGDQMLAAFGDLLSERLRKSDVACRYGGEEFCLLLPHTDAHAARRKVSTLLRLWRNAVFSFTTGAVRENSFSAGIADTQLVSDSVEALLKSADDCVLEAKRNGRGRIVVFEAETQLQS